MDRKKIILIAVLINAGLLAILLIAAIASQEEVVPESTIAAAPLPQFDDRFYTPVVEKKAEEPVIHPLPALEPIAIAPEPIIEPVVAPPVAIIVEPKCSEVKVKKGDSLEKLAKIYQTSVDEIIKLNHLPSSFLKIGQTLKIPTEKKALAKSSSPTKGPEYYTMKVGDNPWSIAMKNHMKVEELLRLNSLNEEKARKLKPGDRLRIR